MFTITISGHAISLDQPMITGGTYICFWILSSAARALPDPKPNGSNFYLFFFTFVHTLGANMGHIREGLAIMGFKAAARQQQDKATKPPSLAD